MKLHKLLDGKKPFIIRYRNEKDYQIASRNLDGVWMADGEYLIVAWIARYGSIPKLTKIKKGKCNDH